MTNTLIVTPFNHLYIKLDNIHPTNLYKPEYSEYLYCMKYFNKFPKTFTAGYWNKDNKLNYSIPYSSPIRRKGYLGNGCFTFPITNRFTKTFRRFPTKWQPWFNPTIARQSFCIMADFLEDHASFDSILVNCLRKL